MSAIDRELLVMRGFAASRGDDDAVDEAQRDVELMRVQIAALEAKVATLARERDDRADALGLNGFVPCDIPACNCGSWHHRYGLPERMTELKDALAESGHPLCNANGNLPRNALRELIAERDDLNAKVATLQALSDEYAERVTKEIEAVKLLRASFVHVREYWNGEPNDVAMRDALDHIIDEADMALEATK